MRRVVVTGMGMVTPLGCGVETTWQRLLKGESGAKQIDTLRRLRHLLQDRLHDPARRRLRRHLQSRSMDGAEGAAQGRRLHRLSPCARRARRSTMPAGSRQSYEDQITTGVLIGSGIGGIEGIADTAITLHEKGPRRVSPFFIPGRIINLASGYRLDRARPQGPQPRGGHRLLDRRACDRRRGAHDRARRCRRDGGGRHRIAGQPHGAGGLCGAARAVDRFQRRRPSAPRAPTTRTATAS